MGREASDIVGEPFGAVVPAPAGHLPPWERKVIAEAAVAALVPLARARRPQQPGTPLLLAVMRDEAARLPGFLAHYRGLGVTRFAIVDHGSADATRALLGAAPDVDLYAAARPFWGKHGWINALIAREGYDRWYLHVDADERLVFDGAGAPGRPGRGLAELVAFAEAQGLRRLRGMLVDLYPPGPLLPPEAGESGPPPEVLFDADGYVEALCLQRVSRRGGPRRRAFAFDHELTKYPLFHIRAGELASSPHHLHPYGENYRSDCFLGILHDKFAAGWRSRFARAAAEGNYWRRSLEYRTTLAALAREPGLGLAYPGSRRYREPSDLVAAGLIAPIPWEGGRPRRRVLGLLDRVAGWSRRPAVELA